MSLDKRAGTTNWMDRTRKRGIFLIGFLYNGIGAKCAFGRYLYFFWVSGGHIAFYNQTISIMGMNRTNSTFLGEKSPCPTDLPKPLSNSRLHHFVGTRPIWHTACSYQAEARYLATQFNWNRPCRFRDSSTGNPVLKETNDESGNMGLEG